MYVLLSGSFQFLVPIHSETQAPHTISPVSTSTLPAIISYPPHTGAEQLSHLPLPPAPLPVLPCPLLLLLLFLLHLSLSVLHIHIQYASQSWLICRILLKCRICNSNNLPGQVDDVCSLAYWVTRSILYLIQAVKPKKYIPIHESLFLSGKVSREDAPKGKTAGCQEAAPSPQSVNVHRSWSRHSSLQFSIVVADGRILISSYPLVLVIQVHRYLSIY